MVIKVLILDDEKDILENYVDDLEGINGIEPVAFTNIRDAYEYFLRNPDVRIIITDNHLGTQKTGNDFVGDVISQCRPVKICVLTGDAHGVEEFYKDVGVKVYEKPTRAGDVVRSLLKPKLKRAA
jgi:DNA-binding NtrC family response regulator